MMRKSFGGSYGNSGSSGGNGIRSVGRVVRTRLNNFQDSLPNPNSSSSTTTKKSSSSTTKSKKTSSSSSSSSIHALSLSSLNNYNSNNNNGVPLPMSLPNHNNKSYLMTNDDGDSVNEGDYDTNEVESGWEYLENYYDPIFGVVPSSHEVQHALLSLQEVFHPQSWSQSATEDIPCQVDKGMDDQTKSDIGTPKRTSSKSSDSDWLEPSMHPYSWNVTQSPGWGRVHDAFHLLQNEPSVQRMVVSLSSDKAVWDAVLNNEAVQEIRDSYRDAAKSSPPNSDEKHDPFKANLNVLTWIFENMKMKLLEVIGNISEYVVDTFKPLDYDKEEQSYAFMEKLKPTFLLTVVVLLIVVVARGHRS